MSRRDTMIYALLGLGVWLNGAITFRLGGRILFENGPLVAAAATVGIAIAVCLVFRGTMAWRKATRADALGVAVTMALPGLLGEAARQLAFTWATGLKPQTQPVFAAAIFFGNSALLTYALWRARGAKPIP